MVCPRCGNGGVSEAILGMTHPVLAPPFVRVEHCTGCGHILKVTQSCGCLGCEDEAKSTKSYKIEFDTDKAPKKKSGKLEFTFNVVDNRDRGKVSPTWTRIEVIDLAVHSWHEVADTHDIQPCNCFREAFGNAFIEADKKRGRRK